MAHNFQVVSVDDGVASVLVTLENLQTFGLQIPLRQMKSLADVDAFVLQKANEYMALNSPPTLNPGDSRNVANPVVPAPVDQSDLNNLEKRIKALGLCVAQVGGLTVPQMKTLFKQKFDSLP